jgi:hypothetical protein
MTRMLRIVLESIVRDSASTMKSYPKTTYSFKTVFILTILLFHSAGCAEKGVEQQNGSKEAGAPGTFTVRGSQLLSPEGKPIKLSGWRIPAGAWKNERGVSLADFQYWSDQGLLGNAQGVEIWWSSGDDSSPSERFPHEVGAYQSDSLPKLLNVLRSIARSGSWIIPSFRLSYDGEVASNSTRTGTSAPGGWAHHRKIIYNDPVVVEEGPHAGTYGNHRDRFFAWLDWIIPQILADKEIADRIAYWEMWHFFGHRHKSEELTIADYDHYLDDFTPRLLAKFREHDPNRLLGVGARSATAMKRLLDRVEDNRWKPWTDKNWILVTGGYGHNSVLMRPDNFGKRTKWPDDSVSPEWLPDSGEFVLEKFIRLTGLPLHSQEGPGLRDRWRETPIPEPQRTWLVGVYNLYNERTNGFGIHAWPPSWSKRRNRDERFDPTPGFDETEFFNLTREALKGNPVR